MCPKKDLTSITDPAQDPACMIGAFGNMTVFTVKPSLSVEPFMVETAAPSPISTAFTAPMDIMAWASIASSLSNTGSPRPEGMPKYFLIIKKIDFLLFLNFLQNLL